MYLDGFFITNKRMFNLCHEKIKGTGIELRNPLKKNKISNINLMEIFSVWKYFIVL